MLCSKYCSVFLTTLLICSVIAETTTKEDASTGADDAPVATVNAKSIRRITTGRCHYDNAIFAEGSAMLSSDECTLCYCIRGERRCVTPKCHMPLEGCIPTFKSYKSSSCCPTFYDCSNNYTVPLTTTTELVTTVATTSKAVPVPFGATYLKAGCFINGRRYFEGQYLHGIGGPCSACYCLKGQKHCTEIKCHGPAEPGCVPIYFDGRCCPVSYSCEDVEVKSDSAITTGVELQVGAHLDVSDFEDGVLENRVRIERQSPIVTENANEETTMVSVEKATMLPHELLKEETDFPIDSESDVAEVPDVRSDVNGKEETLQSEPEPSAEPESNSEPEPSSALEANSEVEANSEPEPSSEPEPISEPEPSSDADFEHAPELANHKLQSLKNESNTTSESDLKTNVSDTNQTPLPEVEEEKTRINDKEINLESLLETLNSEKSQSETNEKPASTPTENKNNFVEPTISAADEEYVDYESGVTEHYTDYPEEPEKKPVAPTDPPKKAPTLSLKELLLGIRNSNDYNEEDSLSSILPDPITGTTIDKVVPPETFIDQVVSSGPVETDFPSYDINVGASVMTGHEDTDNRPVGVGQVFAVDIEEPEEDEEGIAGQDERPSKPSSFFDSFLNLFGGSPKEPPPPKFKNNMLPPKQIAPPPFVGMRPPPPPPPPSFHNDNIINAKVDETKNEFENEVVDLVAKPSHENEVRSDSIAPTGSLTRSDLPIIRRPSENGGRPLRPGLFAARPNGLPPRPLSSFSAHPTLSEDNLEDVRPNQINPESSFPGLPSDPVIEGGFLAIKPTANATNQLTEEDQEPSEPTLPPSLPNLQIIPFVAADAVVNQEGFNPEDFRSTPKPLNPIQNIQTCREGGKVWKNGEIVARGDNDPCILCRCHAGKVVCQRRVCPKTPEGCEAESSPAEGECCPKIKCDKSANVSIIDTIPSFQPLEKIETPLSKPNRPSIFSFGQNRRPAFGSLPVDRMPPRNTAVDQDKTEGTIASLRRPVLPPRLKPSTKPLIVTDAPLTVEGDEEEKEEPRRPVRPSRPASPVRPKLDGPTSARPFSRPSFIGGNRTRPGGTRPPFIPPRHKFTPKPLHEHSIPEPLTTTSSPDTEIIEPQIDKDEIFSNLQPVSIPDLIHPPKVTVTETPAEIIPEKESEAAVESDDDTFIPPPGFLLPRPLPTSRPVNDDDILNFVLQDKFRLPQGSDKFKLPSNRPSPNVLFNIDSRPTKAPPLPVKTQIQQLPEIPESVKAQLPLGNDPILALGLLELGGCNVYGRMYDVGQVIKELSAQCKACQCTKVGVQCLPTC